MLRVDGYGDAVRCASWTVLGALAVAHVVIPAVGASDGEGGVLSGSRNGRGVGR